MFHLHEEFICQLGVAFMPEEYNPCSVLFIDQLQSYEEQNIMEEINYNNPPACFW